MGRCLHTAPHFSFWRAARRALRIGVLLASAGLLLVAAGACARSAGWIPDLLANAAAWIGLAALLLSVVAMAVRAWIAGSLSVVAAIVCGVLVLPGRAGPGPAGPTLTVMTANMRAANDRPDAAAAIVASSADVVVLTEVGGPMNRAIREAAAPTYPYRVVKRPELDEAPRLVVLSRSSIQDVGTDEPGVVRVRVDGPAGGAWTVIGFHAESPRSAAAWRAGLDRVEAVARLARDAAEMGDAVVVAGDLNATPGGVRSVVMRRDGGLARAKPIFAASGTYPAGAPGFARLPIDAVFVSEGLGVRSWSVVEVPGSDHAGLIVGVAGGPGGDRAAGGR